MKSLQLFGICLCTTFLLGIHSENLYGQWIIDTLYYNPGHYTSLGHRPLIVADGHQVYHCTFGSKPLSSTLPFDLNYMNKAEGHSWSEPEPIPTPSGVSHLEFNSHNLLYSPFGELYLISNTVPGNASFIGKKTGEGWDYQAIPFELRGNPIWASVDNSGGFHIGQSQLNGEFLYAYASDLQSDWEVQVMETYFGLATHFFPPIMEVSPCGIAHIISPTEDGGVNHMHNLLPGGAQWEQREIVLEHDKAPAAAAYFAGEKLHLVVESRNDLGHGAREHMLYYMKFTEEEWSSPLLVNTTTPSASLQSLAANAAGEVSVSYGDLTIMGYDGDEFFISKKQEEQFTVEPANFWMEENNISDSYLVYNGEGYLTAMVLCRADGPGGEADNPGYLYMLQWTDDLFQVAFDVVDEEGNFVDDAVVVFNEESALPGTYLFENVPPGYYHYEVSKTGYDTEVGSLVLREEDLLVTVVLHNNQTTGWEEQLPMPVKIYPNPVSDRLNVEVGEPVTVIYVMDQFGKITKTLGPNQGSTSIDVSGMSAGTYFLLIVTKDTYVTEQLIIYR